MAAQKAYLLFFVLNLLFFLFLFSFFFLDLLFAVASLDLKVPMFSSNQEEVMLFDVLA